MAFGWLSREGVLAVLVMAGLAGWFATATAAGVSVLGQSCPAGADLPDRICDLDDLCVAEDGGALAPPLTPICYLMFAAAGGLLAVLALLAILQLPITAALAQAAIVLMLSAWGVKIAWWRLAGQAKTEGSIDRRPVSVPLARCAR